MIKDQDRGYKKRREGLKIKLPPLKVGLFDNGVAKEGSEDLTLIEVAIFNEFGLGNTPERSFIRAWFDQNLDRIKKMILEMRKAVAKGTYTPDQAMNLLGQKFVGEIQARIAEGIPPANAESTRKRKGSSTPLINTGQLRSSITYLVSGK